MVDPSGATSCPEPHILAELASGAMAPSDAATTQQHVSSCALCQAAMAELADEEQLATKLRGATGLEQEASVRSRLSQQLAGDYELLELLGQGGGGMVFKARDLKLGRLVAVKALAGPADDQHHQAALREAGLLARVNHRGIPTVYAVSDSTIPPCIAMELAEGQPITAAQAGQPIQRQMSAFTKLVEAVAELHRRGLVHRDLKPANILIDERDNVKLLDLGIAEAVPGASSTYVAAPRPCGTPAYLAPEQALGKPAQPAADVFSLGVILFELLTGRRPFAGTTTAQLLKAIRQDDPPLPRSLREEIPGPLQAICLMAMEKDPALRYSSASEFLLDLHRLGKGEIVSANPTLLVSVLEHGIDRHVGQLQRWQADRIISARECDYFLDRYDRLRQREELWVLDSRRISFSQVLLHLGAWSCVVSSLLMLVFAWPRLGTWRFALPSALLGLLLAGGEALWRYRNRRVGIVLLIAAACTCPIAVATALRSLGWLDGHSESSDLLPGLLTNRQLLCACASALGLGLVLWRRTRTSAMAPASGLSFVLLATAVMGLLGLRAQLEAGKMDVVAGWYLWPGLILLAGASVWDLRLRLPAFAAPLYVMAIALLIASATLIARYGPTLTWLGLGQDGADLGRQIRYSFMINGLVYLLLGWLASRSRTSRWLRRIGTLLYWLAPSHVLVPILLLEGQWAIGGTGWTVYELLLPAAALAFVLGSVPNQMKSFFFSGLFYLAISVARLTGRHFQDDFAWPIGLSVAGLLLVVLAWRRPTLLDRRRQRGSSSSSDGKKQV